MDDIVEIQTFTTKLEAAVAKSKLDAEGIKSFIEADDAGGAYPFPLSGHMKGVRLLVSKMDAVTATNALK